MYFSSDTAGGLRWTPGSDPEPLPWAPRTVDSRTGAMLVDGEAAGADGWLVIGQHGERANVLVTLTADLAPGGTHLIDFRYSPPAVTLFDVAAGGADPRVWWLPEGCDMSMPRGPAWEDGGHLLLRRPYSAARPPCASTSAPATSKASRSPGSKATRWPPSWNRRADRITSAL